MHTYKMKRPNFQQLYEIAEGQAGYFTASQANAAGFSWERLSYYASTGRFLRVQPGIYRLVQFPNSPHEDLFVHSLRIGPEAVISHDSALYLHQLSDVLPGKTHIIMPRTASRRRKGVRLHTNQLKPGEITHREGLRVTTPARTITDAAASGTPEEQIRLAVQQAIQRGLTSKDELLSMARRRGGKVLQITQRALNREAG